MRLPHPRCVAPALIDKQLGRRSQTGTYFGVKLLRQPNFRGRPINSVTTLIEERK